MGDISPDGVNVVTGDNCQYKFFPVPAGSVNFQVQADNDAHIALTNSMSPKPSSQIYEICIGGWDNRKSVIRKNRKKPSAAVANTPSILSGSQFRSFWVRWDRGTISAGREGETTPFISWQDPEPVPVSFFGVRTFWGAVGTWKIEDSPEFDTPNDEKYIFRRIESGSLEFDVSGLRDCQVCLTSAPGEVDPMYEFIIGGGNNSHTAIRYNRLKPDKVTVSTPFIVTPDAYKKFIIQWRHGKVALNDGVTGKPIVEWVDPKPFHITNFGVRSAPGVPGYWHVKHFLKDSNEHIIKPDPSYQDMMTEDSKNYIYYHAPFPERVDFKVRAEHDARIALASSLKNKEQIYEINIGGLENTKSTIRKNEKKPNKVEVKTPGILCENEYRGFWVRWDSFMIYVGREGETVPFMSWVDPDPFTVNFIGFSTAWGATGKWKIKMPIGAVKEYPDPGAIWESTNDGKVPPNAIVGGYDYTGEKLYVARANHEGDVIPGKLIATHGAVYVSHGGREHKKTLYQVLTGCCDNWVSVTGNDIPTNAVPGGSTRDSETLYIGRVKYQSSVIIGKVIRSHGLCYICFAGRELSFANYEVLVY